MELPKGIEPSSLDWQSSIVPKLRRKHIELESRSGIEPEYNGFADRDNCHSVNETLNLVREDGIDPSLQSYQLCILPLNYTRIFTK